ncbi:MAG: thiamine diphosphokinase [Rhodobacteraceae bacterium]|nr:MAG: thiamine diphosphokinase [Paracoccaceae bacterium]
MPDIIVDSLENVTLIGGGAVDPGQLAQALDLAPVLVAADGGADSALAAGHVPRAVIGDMDSLSAGARATIPPARIHPVPEQDSTDFEKALSRIRAPLVLGLGFMGPRLDHMLAVYHGLLALPERACLLIGATQVAFLCPPHLRLESRAGDLVSAFPLVPLAARSGGLHWALDGLALGPGQVIGTSNRATAEMVEIRPDRPGLLVILPGRALPEAMRALSAPGCAPWPVRA